MRLSMRVLGVLMSGALCVVGVSQAPAAPVVGPKSELKAHPVCEPSAALAVACTDDDSATCVWVGDNERDDELYQYRIGTDGLLTPAPGASFTLKPKGLEVGDIEALASGKGGGVLVFGSHSRKNACTDDHGRAAVALVERDGAKAEAVSGRKGFEDRFVSCKKWVALEDSAPANVVALRDRFCTVMRTEERMANVHEGDEDACPRTAFNIEGAVTLEQDGKLRTWLGLRGPLVDGRAVLLRIADPPADGKKKRLQFDGIATIALGDDELAERGIRELTVAGSTIWGIAGCVRDCETDSRLWRIDAGKLGNGARIAAADAGILAGVALPATAEGLVIQSTEKRAIVLIDGDEGKPECKEKPQQLIVTGLP